MPDVPDMATARALVDGALGKARELGINVSIAVLDSAGHLVAYQRMDGTAPFTADVAQSKAYGGIFRRRTSAELPGMANPRPPFFGARRLGLGQFCTTAAPLAVGDWNR